MHYMVEQSQSYGRSVALARGSGTSDFLYVGGSGDQTNKQEEIYLSITGLNIADGSLATQYYLNAKSGDTFWGDIATARYISHMNFWIEPATGDHYLFGAFESNGLVDRDGTCGIWKSRLSSVGTPTDNISYKSFN